ncbi:glutathione S-transferase N-terminal domain-containing protein, partial [Mycobacterium tuberculosis]|nr:glutathione S-transferase N-terminal domain-containing protein [Mycobacterium tuberculosis]
YKAALMLALSGADWEAVPVAYFAGETRKPEWRDSVNEMGEAPVLEHAGKRFSQSGVILDYLAETLGRFGAADAEERR